MEKKRIFEIPKDITDIDDCAFYHTVDIPGYGTAEGNWDLRDGVDQYFAGVDFKGKEVLEIGPANGFLSFEMEKRGASVTCFDLSGEYDWDIVPYAHYNYNQMLEARKKIIEQINNAFWFSHRRFDSRAKVVYGDAYHLPDEIGEVDIVTFCAILLHVRDPFLALQRGLRFARETVIVTEPLRIQPVEFKEPYMKFLPDPETLMPKDAWWDLRPEIITRMLGVLGFEDVRVTHHTQMCKGKPTAMYTAVGRRTKGKADAVLYRPENNGKLR